MLSFSDPRLARPAGPHRTLQAAAASVALFETPETGARLATQALYGEMLDVFEDRNGFARVQARRDRYTGWAPLAHLSETLHAPTHKIASLRTHVYAAPDLKSPPLMLLSLGARVTITGASGDWRETARGGFIHHRHLAEIDQYTDDPVGIAEALKGSPYLWGGRESAGLDCTGLTQQAFEAAGILLPRDSDMQRAWAGTPVEDWRAPGALQRGDLVFWKGHVGLMTGPIELLHANAWHMAAATEPLETAITRIARLYGEPLGVRRIDLASARAALPDWLAAQT